MATPQIFTDAKALWGPTDICRNRSHALNAHQIGSFLYLSILCVQNNSNQGGACLTDFGLRHTRIYGKQLLIETEFKCIFSKSTHVNRKH